MNPIQLNSLFQLDRVGLICWILQVKALRLQPGSRVGQPTKGGIINSDGEVIAGGDEPESCLMAYGPPIQMTVDKGLATIFSPK